MTPCPFLGKALLTEAYRPGCGELVLGDLREHVFHSGWALVRFVLLLLKPLKPHVCRRARLPGFLDVLEGRIKVLLVSECLRKKPIAPAGNLKTGRKSQPHR